MNTSSIIIYAPDIVGEIERFEFCEETGLYHWHGDSSYCGYTIEELEKRGGRKVLK